MPFRRMPSFTDRRVSGALAAICSASAWARGATSASDGSSSLRSPQLRASGASTSRAVKSSSLARATPRRSTSRFKEAIERVLPRVRAIGIPNLAEGPPSRRSQAAAMAKPPPVQAPRRAAITGIWRPARAPMLRSIRPSYSSASSAVAKERKSEMSVPATKAFSPAPSRTRQRTSSSAAASWQISPRRSYISKVIALRCSGRLKVTQRTGPWRRVRTSPSLKRALTFRACPSRCGAGIRQSARCAGT